MELTYYRHGDYLLPDMGLSEEDRQPIGKYGHMRLDYLRQERPGLYTKLLLSGNLMHHLHEINQTCNERMARLIPQMKASEGITEQLKADDQMEWVRHVVRPAGPVADFVRDGASPIPPGNDAPSGAER